MKLLAPGTYFLTGNVAVAEAALLAGCRFYAGYPITPSSDLMHHMARRLPEVGGVFIQAEDEIAAINMVLGASAAGLKAMTATSGPGLSLMEEALGLGFMLELPAVIVDVMRVGPSTGIPTLGSQGDVMQCIWGSHGDRETVVFAPSTVQEAFDLTIRAFNVSEELRLPVFVLTDEFIAHTYGRVVVPEYVEVVDRKRVEAPTPDFKPFKADDLVPPFPEPGKGLRFHFTGLMHDERGYPIISKTATDKLLRRLLNKVRSTRNKLVDFEVIEFGTPRILVVAYGSLASILRCAFSKYRDEARNVVLFRPRVLWPAPDIELRTFVEKQGVEHVIVAELNYGQYLHVVKEAVGDAAKVSFVSFTPGFYPSPREALNSILEVIKHG